MKTTYKTKYSILLLLGLIHSVAFAGAHATNRLSVAARVGFNIKAKVDYAAGSGGAAPRFTPDGDLYNYDDGYVLTDVSGSAGGVTTYWGYDDAAQDNGSEILMIRTSTVESSGPSSMDADDPQIGAEVTYSHELEVEKNWRFGFDFAASFQPLKYEDKSSFAPQTSTTTDTYGYAGVAPPAAPYQGTFNGPGFLLSSTPSSSSTTPGIPGAVINGKSELDGTLWAVRIGPYMEFPLGDNLALHCAGGLSLAWLDVDVDWSTTGGATANGGGTDSETLSGAFLGADLFWSVTEKWSAAVGVEFEYLNDWEGNFGGSTVQLDFTRSLYATLGISREF